MKRFLPVVFLVLAGVLSGRADALLWRVNEDAGTERYINAARMMVTPNSDGTGGRALSVVYYDPGSESWVTFDGDSGDTWHGLVGMSEAPDGGLTTGDVWVDLSSIEELAEAYFYVEYVHAENWDDPNTWKQQESGTVLSYQDLVASRSVGTPGLSVDGQHALTAPWTSTAQIPEPTSGLLLVWGAALLALRRKQGLA